jgi:AraC-like DNA-binding protein
MDSIYREIDPSPRLAPYVECFWTGEVLNRFSARVLPDGCADILFVSQQGLLTDVRAVGVMTRPREFSLAAGTLLVGVRFHPGMAGVCLGRNLQSLNDQVVPLRSVMDSDADDLARCFSRQRSLDAKIGAIEDRLASLPTVTKVQRAIGDLIGRKGQLALEDFSAAAGLGARQLRRACLQHAGLPPKQLARILRFRHAVTRLRQGEAGMAELALDCGYYDQAHMIREFRDLAGITPGHYLRQHG